MTLNEQLAKQLKDLFLTGQWIGTNLNLKAQLDDVNLEMANTRYESLNTIALLAFHINYYLEGVINVFKGGTLDIKDKYSYDMPPISSEEEWKTMRDNIYRNAEYFVYLVELMPTSKLNDPFTDEKYGTYFKNLIGMLEHSYYHLGQIVLIKKLLKGK
ncbi:MAG: DinB family protein [Saprospiraceae bacterium]|nr:DinB family protein [Saprospiraceae bacterium]